MKLLDKKEAKQYAKENYGPATFVSEDWKNKDDPKDIPGIKEVEIVNVYYDEKITMDSVVEVCYFSFGKKTYLLADKVHVVGEGFVPNSVYVICTDGTTLHRWKQRKSPP